MSQKHIAESTPTSADRQPQDDDLFGRRSIRRALKSLNAPKKLGKHPLTHLDVVRTRCQDVGHRSDNSPSGIVRYGIALHNVLCEAIKSLRPNDGEPRYSETVWHPYLILTRQYVEGCSPEYLADRMCIEPRTYYRKQGQAIDRLGIALAQMERHFTERRSGNGDLRRPFMAPPCPPYDLVGRDALLHSLKQRLFSGESLALSALNGLPGVGKTALAIELANDLQVLDHFEDGVLWVGLGRQPDVLALLGMWGRVLNIAPDHMAKLDSVEERAKLVHAAISTRRMLLVMDDAWQAEDGLAFKLGGPNCAHLLTTRIPEVALVFADGGITKVCELGDEDGLVLLGRLASEAVRSKPDKARALVQAVGGLPLALTLMGGYLRRESQSGQPRRLQAAFDRLRRSETRLRLAQPQTLLERRSGLPAETPNSLLTVIGLSEEALDETARDALWALAAFPPKPSSFSEEAALAVTCATTETLDRLVDSGLLECIGSGRYTLHQTIIDYARARSCDGVACERMVSYFVRYTEMHKKHYAALDMENDNIVAALEMASAREMSGELTRGAHAFFPFLETRGLWARAERIMGRAKQVVRSSGDVQGLTMVLRKLGSLAQARGDYAQAEAHLREGLALARETENDREILAILNGLGAVALCRGDFAQAERLYQQGLAQAHELDDRRIMGHLLGNLGLASRGLGHLKRAGEYCQQALAIARETDDRRKECIDLGHLGAVYTDLGQVDKAIGCHQQALAVAQEIGDRRHFGMALGNIAFAEHHDLGQAEQAIERYRQALAIFVEIGDRRSECNALGNLGDAYRDLGRVEADGSDLGAIDYYRRALAIAREIGDRRQEGEWLGGLANAYRDLGQVERDGSEPGAIDYYRQALAIAREIGERIHESWHLGGLGEAYRRLGQTGQAIECYQQAVSVSRETGARTDEGRWLGDLGVCYHDLGQLERAIEYGEAALAILEELENPLAVAVRKDLVEWRSELFQHDTA